MLKCLWCGGFHASAFCPNRGGGGNLQNRKRAFGSFIGMLSHCPCCEKVSDDEVMDFPDDEVKDWIETGMNSGMNNGMNSGTDSGVNSGEYLVGAGRQVALANTRVWSPGDRSRPAAQHTLMAVEDDYEDCSDGEEFLAFNLEMSRNIGILDGGATKSAGGIEQLEYLQQSCAEHDVEVEVGKSAIEFTFADGERSAAGSTVIVPVQSLDNEKVVINCVDKPTPILLGLDFHRQLECVVDYKNNTCWSYKLNRFLDVTQLPSRHLGLMLAPLQ